MHISEGERHRQTTDGQKEKKEVNSQINFTRNLNLGMSMNYSFLYVSISVVPIIVLTFLSPEKK